MSKSKAHNENYQSKSQFRWARERAKKMAGDPRKIEKLIKESVNKLNALGESNNERLNRFFEQLYTLKRLLNAYVKGTYKSVPWKTLVTLIAGLIYFVTPFDFIPDFIPVTGFIDDASVLIWIFSSFKNDIRDFEVWENEVSNKEG